MKHFLTALALSTGLLTSATAAPNVIFILVDDLGYGDLYNTYQHVRDNGAGGGVASDGIRNGSEKPFIYTPHIDCMASEGARLLRHYTAAPVCAPARGSLMQGRDQGHANIRNNSFDKVVADNHTLGTVLKEAGYYTAAIGKWGIGGSSAPWSGHPNYRGFDYFYGHLRHTWGHHHYPVPSPKAHGAIVYEDMTAITTGLDHAYTADLWTAKAKQIIKNRAQNHPSQPFFIYLAYDTPHAQLQVPTQAYPAKPGLNGGIQWLGTSGQMINTATGTDDSYIHSDYTGLTNQAAKRHATMVRRLDNCVGDLLQTLRDLGIAENTLVVFTSDNGPHDEGGQDPRYFQSYGKMEGIKRDEWEAGIREPTFVWWPGHIGDDNPATPPLDSSRPSAFWDWMATFTDAAGVVPPAWSNGVSLLPELTGNGNQLDKGYLYSEYHHDSTTPQYPDFANHGGSTRGQMQFIFLKHSDGKNYKGIRTGITKASDNFQIYDVDKDPAEAHNLAPSMPTLQQRMKDRVLQVRIDGDYSRPNSNAKLPAITTSVTDGLEFKAFEGSWAWVPETAYLAPASTGTSTKLDLSKRTRDDNIALEFTGYIRVPIDGTYTFQMTSDETVSTHASGSMLWIHDANIIDDDFNHTGASKSGTVRLAAGLHPIRILYKHATGHHGLSLQYSGPGISLQTVPHSALFRDKGRTSRAHF